MNTLKHLLQNYLYVITLIAGIAYSSLSQAQDILPRPQLQKELPGTFVINENTHYYTNLKGKDKRMMVKYLRTLPFQMSKTGKKDSLQTIRLLLIPEKKMDIKNPQSKASLQGYKLDVSPTGIKIQAYTSMGLFYGLQSILQLIRHSSLNSHVVPCTEITDTPRFPYRGLMIDISRHFFPKEFIYKQIDALAYYKMSYLHLHLTDAGGWRIQIKKYPKLTKEGAYRTESDWTKWWSNGSRLYCDADRSGAYGGYYTQHDIKDIVKYATLRHITVVPEIEMPGHSEEVLAAYPELACSGKPYTNSDYCVGKEITFRFIENVLKEVMKLFPSEYIHIGGDEAGKKAWKTCPLCQKRMADEHLNNVDELQSYLICRIERFLNSHGRKLLGWDEILQGKLAPKATVMSWRGEEGGITAAKAGHQAIMTPGRYCYLDHAQDAPYSQPKSIGGYTPLDKTYSYNPVPDSLKAIAPFIIGVQGNLWTEYVPTPEHAEYMIYPRILALAEIGWTDNHFLNGTPVTDASTLYPDFRRRASKAIEYLQARGYHPFDLSKEVGHRPESKETIYHEAIGKKVTYDKPYSTAYPAQGDKTLTDGRRGDWEYGDGAWQGFIGTGRLDVTVDMETITDLHNISAEFMQSSGPEIFAPAEVIVSISDDGVNFRELDKQTYEVNREPDYFFRQYQWKGNAKGRYIRIQAHATSTMGGWIFTDEIVVNQK